MQYLLHSCDIILVESYCKIHCMEDDKFMEEMNNNYSFVYIDKNPKMKLIGYTDIRDYDSARMLYEEDTTGLKKIA